MKQLLSQLPLRCWDMFPLLFPDILYNKKKIQHQSADPNITT